MAQGESARGATELVAERVRELRKRRGWSAARLAKEMTSAGVPWDRSVVANLENGRRASVTVDELLALAVTLDVGVVNLLVPPLPSPLWGGNGDSRSPDDPNDPNDRDTLYRVTPTLTAPYYRVRQLVRGWRPLRGMDPWRFFSEAPPQERPSGDALRRMVETNARYADE